MTYRVKRYDEDRNTPHPKGPVELQTLNQVADEACHDTAAALAVHGLSETDYTRLAALIAERGYEMQFAGGLISAATEDPR